MKEQYRSNLYYHSQIMSRSTPDLKIKHPILEKRIDVFLDRVEDRIGNPRYQTDFKIYNPFNIRLYASFSTIKRGNISFFILIMKKYLSPDAILYLTENGKFKHVDRRRMKAVLRRIMFYKLKIRR